MTVREAEHSNGSDRFIDELSELAFPRIQVWRLDDQYFLCVRGSADEWHEGDLLIARQRNTVDLEFEAVCERAEQDGRIQQHGQHARP